jgi:rSAM/selenodomain-associated transferase 1
LNDRCAIAVMAKAPKPGRVKTRLSPPLSPDQAMQMGAGFLRDITENLALAARSAPIDAFVAYAPAGDAGLFDGHLASGTRLLLADGAIEAPPGVSGFGCCLLQTIDTLLVQGYGAACVLNADSPTLPTELLLRLAGLLAADGDRAVLGPAEDGGYYVLGMKARHPMLFADIAWSTGQVAEQTRARARRIGLAMSELPPWYDIDDVSSLHRLLQAAPDGSLTPYAAPATFACARAIGLAELLARRAA